MLIQFLVLFSAAISCQASLDSIGFDEWSSKSGNLQQQESEAASASAGACKATFAQGTLDLSPLDSADKPRFKNFAKVQIMGISYNLSFNPCSPFDCGVIATDSICATGNLMTYGMGEQNSSRIEGQPPSSLRLRYKGSSQLPLKPILSTVRLVCNATEDGRISNVVLTDGGNYNLTFDLHSRYCCLTPSPSGGNTGWSPGDVIVLLFCLSVALYILVSMLINGLVRRRSGADLLPNGQFWCHLALLIKDGFEFSFKTIRSCLCKGRENYSKI
ncbi:hypothetical protein BOX15_Mlig005077g1 [Macrostomum lignano]|uniref:Uncharacterized protein n=1 Tax=Macrostomum lignano TaxID=282301 RepID=A0A267GR87_9PLAT|nr:hypothetical protein BOX15_Mlig005077g4 [Macrostomum lignano]PAA57534.1 hypothetical protein BOX15_Mlig005077g3 [Macrostomum lignano]PAA87914.1 hypothetical protein BOX15_Mlig005077g1 [Macrostomum lignano]